MIVFLCCAALCATTLFAVKTLLSSLGDKWAQDRAARQTIYQSRFLLDARRIAVSEREITLKEKQLEARPAEQPMPDDLIERINSWDEEWAQEDERRGIMTLYGEYRDWDKVRSKLVAIQ